MPPIESIENGTRSSQIAPWLKWFLLTLLLLFAFAGIAYGIFHLSQTSENFGSLTAPLREFSKGNLPDKKPPLEKLFALMGKAGFQTSLEISCQGTMTGADGGALVILNDRMAMIGAEVDGILIVEISPADVLIEYKGTEYTLKTGESITIVK